MILLKMIKLMTEIVFCILTNRYHYPSLTLPLLYSQSNIGQIILIVYKY